jgi:hypothetical protein
MRNVRAYYSALLKKKGACFRMPTTDRHHEPDYVYALSRAFSHDGTVNASREQRLCCALVELRDRVQEEFLKVSKNWQVAAQDLRRCYSYAYPASEPGEPDPLCLELACKGVMTDLRSSIHSWSKQYGVEDGTLEEMLVDWLVSDAMGKERTPSAFFMPETGNGTQAAAGDPVGKLSSVWELIVPRPRRKAGAGE